MEDTAQEQVDTTVSEATEEPTEEQLDAEFEADDDVVVTKDDEKSPEKIAAEKAAAEQTPEEKAAAEEAEAAAAKEAAEAAKTDEEKATEAAEAKAAEDAKKEQDAAKKKEEAAATAVPEPTAEEKAAAEKAASDAATADRAQFIESMMKDLNDVEIGDGGTEEAPMPKTFGEFAEQFPEIATTMQVMLGHLRDTLTGQMTPIQEMLQTQEQTAAANALYTELAEDYGHPDAAAIINSKEFHDWVDRQSPAYQSYVDAVTTAADASPILTRHKADVGIETPAADDKEAKAAEALAEKQRAAKAQKDELHSATTRTKKAVTTSKGKGDSEEDLDKLFDEDD